METLVAQLQPLPVVWVGFLASLAAGLGTLVGALPIYVTRSLSARVQDSLLGFAAGIMLAASFFSLILPALEAAEASSGPRSGAVGVVVAGILLGAVVLWLIHRYVPHEHFILGTEGPVDRLGLERVWLFIIAITLHNFPEGMAVGVGFGGDDLRNGLVVAAGIGLQNIPEGLAVAVSMAAIGYSRTASFLVAALTGLAEPVGGLLGVTAVTVAEDLLPWGLAFAGGAMLFIISDEIIPETHRRGFEESATFSLMIGFVVMMSLDVTLG